MNAFLAQNAPSLQENSCSASAKLAFVLIYQKNDNFNIPSFLPKFPTLLEFFFTVKRSKHEIVSTG